MADDTEFQSIWVNAMTEYERDTGRNLKIDPRVQDLTNIEDLLSEIQDSEQRFKDFRASQPKLWRTLRHCMTPVQLVAGLLQDSLGSTPYAPLSILFGAMLYMVKVCSVLGSISDIARALTPLGREWRAGLLQQHRESSAPATRFHGSIARICQVSTRCESAETADRHPEHVRLLLRNWQSHD